MSPKSLIILGRQPALGLAELESLLGADKIQPLTDAALVSAEPAEVPFTRLGGSIKLARVITQLNTNNWREIEKHLLDSAPHHAEHLPVGKLKLGLSVYGLSIHPKELERTALTIKKVLSQSGRSVRVIPNKEPALSSAQVLHNKLTGELGWELIFIKDGSKTWLAQTVAVQDINAYSARDQTRPKRDAKVGMLPPKLAQIIVNLVNPAPSSTVLDPFCGTGVVLQEALLMGYGVYGTDLEPRMIEYSKVNLDWLNLNGPNVKLQVGDAAKYQWTGPIEAVCAETYLGQPLSAIPAPDQFNKIVSYVDRLHVDFLRNIHAQLKSDTKLCLAVPAWKLKEGFRHLQFLDHLTDMGYNRLSFVHAKTSDLIYHRENQVVGRELLVITRI